jgi:hypothetical protein
MIDVNAIHQRTLNKGPAKKYKNWPKFTEKNSKPIIQLQQTPLKCLFGSIIATTHAEGDIFG